VSRRVLKVAVVLFSAVALSWLLLWLKTSDDSFLVAANSPVAASQSHDTSSDPMAHVEPESVESPAGSEPAVQAPVDVTARERFNERARAFFATAAQMTAGDRVREAQQLEQELTRLEQAGGLSAGETLLIRAGLIRETVPAGAQQDAQLQALQERYRAETQLRVAAAQARPDPQFGSYKVRESEIVNEVMAMETIPDGLSRDEYLRRRLQSAREQLTPQ
jgi:hypothetical protein